MPREPHHRDHNERQRTHFGPGSLSNPRMIPVDTPYVARHVDAMVAAVGLTSSDRVLDVGCGMGRFTIPLLERGHDVVGLDLSDDLVADLRARVGPDLHLYCADLLDPPEELEGGFDVVVGFFVLHHLPDLEAAFRSVRRCLAPGGRVGFIEPNGYSPLYPLQITITPQMSWRADRGILRMRRRLLREAVTSAGFIDVSQRWFGLFPPAITNRGGDRVESALARVGLPGPVSSFQLVTARDPGQRQ